MKRFDVLLTQDAANDLEAIYDYVASEDGPGRAERLLARFRETFSSLGQHPNRGSYPRELSALGIREYRQVYLKPYRIIYRTISNNVYIYLVADGRRDMRTLLEHRLLRGK